MARPTASFARALLPSVQHIGPRRMFASTPTAAAFGFRKPSEPPRLKNQFDLSRDHERAETSAQGLNRHQMQNHADQAPTDLGRTASHGKPASRARFGLKLPSTPTPMTGSEIDAAESAGGSLGTRIRPHMVRREQGQPRRDWQPRSSSDHRPAGRSADQRVTDKVKEADDWIITNLTHRTTRPNTDQPDLGMLERPTSPRTWQPTKKLTYQAMAGLRSLHAHDPVTFSKETLSQRYGISYDAVKRIIRSRYQDKKGGGKEEKIQGTKWDLNPGTSRLSPVPAVARAFGQRDRARALSLAQARQDNDGK